jgi:triosephosphate isomerase
VSEQTRKTIIAGNWKMHKTRHKARELAEEIVAAVKHDHKNLPEIVLCPPFTALHDVVQATHNSPVSVGAQTMEYRTSGAFTGEISPTMLTDLGVTYVIIGHSERRQYYNETDKTVNLKLKAALEHRLLPIVCVGETLDEREKNETDEVIRRQLLAALADVSEAHVKPLVIAYEPVWAIGTGKSCESVEANRVAKFIRSVISEFYNNTEGSAEKKQAGNHVPVLYGGSVKPSTVDELMAQSDVDGALVGGAALTAEDFVPLIESAHKRIKQQLSRV